MGTRNWNQSKSEMFRYTQKDQEDRVARALEYWLDCGIRVLQQWTVCFTCGKHFERIDPSQYASSCRNNSCRAKFIGKGTNCQPDIIIQSGGRKAIVFVNGSIHDVNDRRRYLDKYQITRLREFGYKIFVIKNKAIDALPDFNLISMAKGWVDLLLDDELYKKLAQREREIFLGSGI